MKKTVMAAGVGIAALVAVPAIAWQMTPDHHAPLTRAAVQTRTQTMFAQVDANRDGSVTRAEADAAKAKHRAEREAGRGQRRQAMFALLDADKNGQLSPQEFATRPARPEGEGKRGNRHGKHGMGGMHHRGGHGIMMGDRLFERLDGDANGAVTLAEAQAKALQHFDAADTNRDGTLSADEMRAGRRAHHAAPSVLPKS